MQILRPALSALPTVVSLLIAASSVSALPRSPTPEIGTGIVLVQISQENDAAWQSLKDRCTDIRHYNASSHQLSVSQQQFISYLRQVERANPGKTRAQIAAALHAASYSSDLDRTLPGTSIPLFAQGPETDGWQDVDLVCKVKVLNRMEPFVPKFVFTDTGKMVDIGHAFAGIRSDLNRFDKGGIWSTFMRQANTALGDYWQVLTDSYRAFPADQLRGDLLGTNIAGVFRNPDNGGVTLSDAFDNFFATNNQWHRPDSPGDLVSAIVKAAQDQAARVTGPGASGAAAAAAAAGAGVPPAPPPEVVKAGSGGGALDKILDEVGAAQRQPPAGGNPMDTILDEILDPGGNNRRTQLTSALDAATAELDQLLVAWDSAHNYDSGKCERLSKAVAENGGPETIDGRISTYHRQIDELTASASSSDSENQADLSLLRTISSSLDTIAANGTSGAEDACIVAGTSDPDTSAINAAVSKARSLDALASTMAAEASVAADRLLKRASNTADLPTEQQGLDRLRDAGTAFMDFCTNLSEPFSSDDAAIKSLRARIEALQTKIDDLVAAAAGIVDEQKLKDYGLKSRVATFRMLIVQGGAKYEERTQFQTVDPSVSAGDQICHHNREIVFEKCKSELEKQGRFDGPVAYVGSATWKRFKDALDRTLVQRQDAAKEGEALAKQIEALARKGTAAVASAQQCQADALAKKPATAEEITEATELGDPARAACSADDLRKRAGALAEPKFNNVPGVRDRIAEIERAATAIDAANNEYAAARAAFKAGNTYDVRIALDMAKARIDSLAGKPDCTDILDKIRSAGQKTDDFDREVSDANGVLGRCDQKELTDAAAKLSDSSHKTLVGLREQMQARLAHWAELAAAAADYRAGEFDAARARMIRLSASLDSLPGGECQQIRDRARDGRERTAAAAKKADEAGKSVRQCDMEGIKRFKLEAEQDSSPAARKFLDQIAEAMPKCTAFEEGRKGSECKFKYPEGATLSAADANGQFNCVPTQAAADGWCRRTKSGLGWKAKSISATGDVECIQLPPSVGSSTTCQTGYSPGKPDKKGDVYCIPTKKTADAWCMANNGNRAVAGKIKADGSFGCNWTKKGQTANAWDACRKQNPGRVVDVKILKNGRFQCITRQVAKRTPPRTEPGYTPPSAGTQQRHDPQSSAAAAAAATSIIQGIIGLSGNRGGGGQPTGGYPPPGPSHVPSYTPPPPPSCGAGCRPQGWRLINGQWMGGVCVCSRLQ